MTDPKHDSPSARIRIWAAGRALGKYELLLPVARGGMAQVWAARFDDQGGESRLVAIKTILPDLDHSEHMERMLLDEAWFAARIRHPNVIETLELGVDQGVSYLVMEWFDGEPLNVAAQLAAGNGGMPIEHACNLIAQVCRGLHAVHELTDESGASLGLVHRDVSPQNILVNHLGLAKLVDFGIAKATNRDSPITGHGEVKGKFTYMAPEQIRGEPLDRRTDVFALGVVLYSLTTNRHPFRGRSLAETVRRIGSSAPVLAPSRVVEDFPPALEAVVLRALAKDRDQRHASAAELADALQAAVPRAFGAEEERRLELYLRALLEERLKQRSSLLRRAQQEREAGAPGLDASGAYSVGSLKAIAVDTDVTTPIRIARREEITVVEPLPPPLPWTPPRSRWRRPLAISAAALLLAVIAVTAPSFRAAAPIADTPRAASLPAAALAPVVSPEQAVIQTDAGPDASRRPAVAPKR